MRTETLLVEIGTEELPPKALRKLSTAFADGIQAALSSAELSFAAVKPLAAPRRLAVLVTELQEAQEDKIIEKRGPAVNVAFDADGQPTKAAEGWARSNGITVEQAERLKTDKGEWLLHKAQQNGQRIHDLLQDIVTASLAKLPIPKMMRWGDSNEQFIRPVHTVCALYGAESVDITILGVNSGVFINGHRFHGNGQFAVTNAETYIDQLANEYVLVDFEQRRSAIASQLDTEASALGLEADYSSELLDEIASLVEWPVVLQASFDESFLNVPKEALIYTMKDDQKYVPLLDAQGQLSSTFLFVSNIESSDPTQVIQGNERVIRPRLADAQFFFETDKKQTLESRLASLDTVIFQKQLGTLADKSSRIANVAYMIAQQLNADADSAKRAGELCKADLMTNMVMEFPDVQGVMGMHYANHDGEAEDVANALFEQYLPRFSGDVVARSPISISVALADKFDSLVGIFGIGQLPKGDKDPFALRRAAIGVLRTIIDNQLDLDLVELIAFANNELEDKLSNAEATKQVLEFIQSRYSAIYADKGISPDVLQAVTAKQITVPSDFNARILAVHEFSQHPAAQSLASAHKRIANILNKNNVSTSVSCDATLFEATQENALYEALSGIQDDVVLLEKQRDYVKVLELVATLKDTVDAFFDNVMVMAEDEATRNNRLALLVTLRTVLESVAEISKLAVKN